MTVGTRSDEERDDQMSDADRPYQCPVEGCTGRLVAEYENNPISRSRREFTGFKCDKCGAEPEYERIENERRRARLQMQQMVPGTVEWKPIPPSQPLPPALGAPTFFNEKAQQWEYVAHKPPLEPMNFAPVRTAPPDTQQWWNGTTFIVAHWNERTQRYETIPEPKSEFSSMVEVHPKRAMRF